MDSNHRNHPPAEQHEHPQPQPQPQQPRPQKRPGQLEVCFTGASPGQTNAHRHRVEQAGHWFEKSLTGSADVLVVFAAGTKKEQAARENNIRCVREEWLTAGKCRPGNIGNFPALRLHGLRVCSTGLQGAERTAVAEFVARNGGKYEGMLTRETHLLIVPGRVSFVSDKTRYAAEHDVPMVSWAELSHNLFTVRLDMVRVMSAARSSSRNGRSDAAAGTAGAVAPATTGAGGVAVTPPLGAGSNNGGPSSALISAAAAAAAAASVSADGAQRQSSGGHNGSYHLFSPSSNTGFQGAVVTKQQMKHDPAGVNESGDDDPFGADLAAAAPRNHQKERQQQQQRQQKRPADDHRREEEYGEHQLFPSSSDSSRSRSSINNGNSVSNSLNKPTADTKVRHITTMSGKSAAVFANYSHLRALFVPTPTAVHEPELFQEVNDLVRKTGLTRVDTWPSANDDSSSSSSLPVTHIVVVKYTVTNCDLDALRSIPQSVVAALTAAGITPTSSQRAADRTNNTNNSMQQQQQHANSSETSYSLLGSDAAAVAGGCGLPTVVKLDWLRDCQRWGRVVKIDKELQCELPRVPVVTFTAMQGAVRQRLGQVVGSLGGVQQDDFLVGTAQNFARRRALAAKRAHGAAAAATSADDRVKDQLLVQPESQLTTHLVIDVNDVGPLPPLSEEENRCEDAAVQQKQQQQQQQQPRNNNRGILVGSNAVVSTLQEVNETNRAALMAEFQHLNRSSRRLSSSLNINSSSDSQLQQQQQQQLQQSSALLSAATTPPMHHQHHELTGPVFHWYDTLLSKSDKVKVWTARRLQDQHARLQQMEVSQNLFMMPSSSSTGVAQPRLSRAARQKQLQQQQEEQRQQRSSARGAAAAGNNHSNNSHGVSSPPLQQFAAASSCLLVCSGWIAACNREGVFVDPAKYILDVPVYYTAERVGQVTAAAAAAAAAGNRSSQQAPPPLLLPLPPQFLQQQDGNSPGNRNTIMSGGGDAAAAGAMGSPKQEKDENEQQKAADINSTTVVRKDGSSSSSVAQQLHQQQQQHQNEFGSSIGFAPHSARESFAGSVSNGELKILAPQSTRVSALDLDAEQQPQRTVGQQDKKNPGNLSIQIPSPSSSLQQQPQQQHENRDNSQTEPASKCRQDTFILPSFDGEESGGQRKRQQQHGDVSPSITGVDGGNCCSISSTCVPLPPHRQDTAPMLTSYHSARTSSSESKKSKTSNSNSPGSNSNSLGSSTMNNTITSSVLAEDAIGEQQLQEHQPLKQTTIGDEMIDAGEGEGDEEEVEHDDRQDPFRDVFVPSLSTVGDVGGGGGGGGGGRESGGGASSGRERCVLNNNGLMLVDDDDAASARKSCRQNDDDDDDDDDDDEQPHRNPVSFSNSQFDILENSMFEQQQQQNRNIIIHDPKQIFTVSSGGDSNNTSVDGSSSVILMPQQPQQQQQLQHGRSKTSSSIFHQFTQNSQLSLGGHGSGGGSAGGGGGLKQALRGTNSVAHGDNTTRSKNMAMEHSQFVSFNHANLDDLDKAVSKKKKKKVKKISGIIVTDSDDDDNNNDNVVGDTEGEDDASKNCQKEKQPAVGVTPKRAAAATAAAASSSAAVSNTRENNNNNNNFRAPRIVTPQAQADSRPSRIFYVKIIEPPTAAADDIAIATGTASTGTASKKPPSSSKDKAAISPLVKQEQQRIESLIEDLGGQLTITVALATHLVTDTMRKDGPQLQAVAGGKWCVHTSFVTASAEAGAWVDEGPYEWCGDFWKRHLERLARSAHAAAVGAFERERAEYEQYRASVQQPAGQFAAPVPLRAMNCPVKPRPLDDVLRAVPAPRAGELALFDSCKYQREVQQRQRAQNRERFLAREANSKHNGISPANSKSGGKENQQQQQQRSEVIVIDDSSADDSKNLLTARQYDDDDDVDYTPRTKRLRRAENDGVGPFRDWRIGILSVPDRITAEHSNEISLTAKSENNASMRLKLFTNILRCGGYQGKPHLWRSWAEAAGQDKSVLQTLTHVLVDTAEPSMKHGQRNEILGPLKDIMSFSAVKQKLSFSCKVVKIDIIFAALQPPQMLDLNKMLLKLDDKKTQLVTVTDAAAHHHRKSESRARSGQQTPVSVAGTRRNRQE